MRENFKLDEVNNFTVPLRSGPIFFTTVFVSFTIKLTFLRNESFQVQYNDSNIKIIHPDNLVDPSLSSVVIQVFDATWTNSSKKQREQEEFEDIEMFERKKLKQKAEDEVNDFLLEMEAEDYGYYKI